MALTILGETTVEMSAAGEQNGAAWGPWKPRAARLSNGDVVFVTMAGNPNYEAGGNPGLGTNTGNPWWQYTHTWSINVFDHTAHTWSKLTNPHASQAICGREPPCLLIGPSDEIYIIGWPPRNMAAPLDYGASPVLFRQSTGFTPEPLPGDWSQSPASTEHWPYSGASIDINGRIILVQCMTVGAGITPNVPGAFKYGWATPVSGSSVTWQMATIPSSHVPLRATLPYPVQNGAGFFLIATADTLREEQGYPVAPNGAWDYIENISYMWRFATMTSAATDPAIIQRVLPTGNVIPKFYVYDVYRDIAGLVHLVCEWDGNDLPNGLNYTTAHVIIDSAGNMTISQITLPFGNLGRMTQDVSGRFYFMSLYGGILYYQVGLDADTDGTLLTATQQLSLAGSYPSGNQYNVYHVAQGSPIGRSGTRGLSNEMHILFDLDNFRWYSLRVQLSSAAPAPPPPDPTPTLTARVTNLETSVATLNAQFARLRKGLHWGLD